MGINLYSEKELSQTTKDILDGIKAAVEANPDAKSFEELAKWAGSHILLTKQPNKEK